jgi:hypothetical protein
MRVRKEHGGPLRKRNRFEVAYAMRVAVLLGKPSRSQRNLREDQRVLLFLSQEAFTGTVRSWSVAAPTRQPECAYEHV